MSFLDRCESACMWIAVPTVMMTENSSRKSIRLIGWAGAILLYPLMAFGLCLLFIAAIANIINDI